MRTLGILDFRVLAEAQTHDVCDTMNRLIDEAGVLVESIINIETVSVRVESSRPWAYIRVWYMKPVTL